MITVLTQTYDLVHILERRFDSGLCLLNVSAYHLKVFDYII